MDDCRLVLEIRDGQVLQQAENVSMVELAYLCGVLEHITGLEAYRRGKPLDDIKTDMLDLNFEAMAALECQIEQERSGKHGS